MVEMPPVSRVRPSPPRIGTPGRAASIGPRACEESGPGCEGTGPRPAQFRRRASLCSSVRMLKGNSDPLTATPCSNFM